MEGYWPEEYSSYGPAYGDVSLFAPTWMERSASNETQPSSDDMSWSGSMPPEKVLPTDNNKYFLMSPESSPVPDFDFPNSPEAEDSSFAQPLDHAEAFPHQGFDIKAAARQATDYAAFHLVQYPGLQTAFITPEAVDALEQELSYAESPTREAIQTLLRSYLCGSPEGTPVADTETLLLEAAYQLQLRTAGPAEEVTDICYAALVVTLMQLGGIASNSPPPPQLPSPAKRAHKRTPKAKAERKRHVCHTAECEGEPKAFSRAADLDRHQNQVHFGGKNKFPCDYGWCTRHKYPFSRQDHFRVHLRTFHFEDLTTRRVKTDENWWAQRSRVSTGNGWWRCNKCVVTRVHIETDGFVCPWCGSHCEAERAEYRRALEERKRMEGGE